jgi:hypothetical protein
VTALQLGIVLAAIGLAHLFPWGAEFVAVLGALFIFADLLTA